MLIAGVNMRNDAMQLLNQGKRLIRLPEVMLLTGRCRASIYKDISANIF
ncbi:AlpA family phage regulatory protein, partial [Salmonella enterica]|nr:AlpA family phage regulatory protein [Salmonella enterica]